MANQATATHGVMEGGGSYNLHARIPAVGANLALPFLEQAVKNITLETNDQPVVIADYGSSQGKNSLAPMRAAIKAVRARVGPERPILVMHVDQAANDFNTLFNVLHSDPERYSADDPNVFPSAIGRSFYENVFPKGHVHLGWSSYAAVWLSRIPTLIPGHFMALASTGDVRDAFDRQGAEDWKFFLSLRANELRSGGRLVVVLPGLGDDGSTGFEPLFRHANEVVAEMVGESAITADDRTRMVLGTYPRCRSQLLAPFAADGQFRRLTVEHCELFVVPDVAWTDYERDGNKLLLLNRHAAFFRAVFVPSLASAVADEAKRRLFPDRLEEKLKRRLAERPIPFHSFVQTMVLAKRSSSPI
jgi:DNA-binding transcriptional regulator/RsmH inhibitor MraZ